MKLSERERALIEKRLLALELDNTVLKKGCKESDEQVALLTKAWLRTNTILKVIIAKCPTAQQLFHEAEAEMATKGMLLFSDAERRLNPAAPAPAATPEMGGEVTENGRPVEPSPATDAAIEDPPRRVL